MSLKEEESQRKVTRYYDNNVFPGITWKRINFFAMSLFTIVLEVYFVHISFTNIFSENLWYFIAGFKVLGVIVENVAEILLQDNLMLSPLSATMGLMENLCTFGAPDFLEFIHSFILGLGVQMAERTYIEPVKDIVVDYLKEKIDALRKWISKYEG